MHWKLGQKIIDKIRNKNDLQYAKILMQSMNLCLSDVKIIDARKNFTFLTNDLNYNYPIILINTDSNFVNFSKIRDFFTNTNFEFIGTIEETASDTQMLFVNKNIIDINKIFLLNKKNFKNTKYSIKKYIQAKQKNFYQLGDTCTSEIPIDVLLCTCSKDFDTLGLVVDSIKHNVNHPINNIYIVAPKGEIECFCMYNNCIFIDENDFLQLKPKDINYKPRGIDRSGWIFQQLVKLNSDTIGNADYILVADSDSVFSTPQCFIDSNNKIIMDISDEWHVPYSSPMSLLVPNVNRLPISFVAHHMLFDKNVLKELKNEIQKNTKQIWYNAIISSLDINELSSFSEFELYGNYIYTKYKEKLKLKYWYNIVLQRKDFSFFQNKDLYKTISMHDYAQNYKIQNRLKASRGRERERERERE